VREHTPVANARILYGVTDSVFVHLPQTGREKAFQIARDLTEGRTVGGLELEIEGVFTALQITQLNLYAGWLHVGPQDTVGRAEMRGTIGRQITTAPFIARAEERAVRTWALQPNPHTDGDEAPPGPDQWELVTGWSRATAGEAGGEVAQELITGGLPLRDGLMGKASRLVPHIKVGADGRLRPLAGAPWSEVNVEAYMSLGKLAASGVAAETLPGGAVTCRPRRGGKPPAARTRKREAGGQAVAGSAPKFARLAQPTLARQRERREYSWRQPSRASPVSQDPVSRPDVRGVPDIAWAALDTPLTQCYDGQGWAAPVPLRYQAAWVEAVRLPLRRILSQERGSALWEQAWRLLHLLPRMLLLAHPREGLPLEDFEDRLRRFWAGDWRSLLPLRPGARIVLPDSDLPDAPGQAHHTWQEGGAGRGGNDWANTSRRVTELLAQGERSRAVRLLTSPGLADRTDASYHRIVAYRPASRRPDQLRELQIGGVAIAGEAAPRRGGLSGSPPAWRARRGRGAHPVA
jgi:hypothetical protein